MKKTLVFTIVGLQIIVSSAMILIASCHSNASRDANSYADSIANARKNDSLARINATSNNIATGNVRSAGDSGKMNNGNTANQHSWTLVITPGTSKNHLDSVSTQWKRENISLDFSKLKYDNSGNLIKIKGTVDITNKAGNHASGEFKSENLSSIQIKVDDSPNVSIKGN